LEGAEIVGIGRKKEERGGKRRYYHMLAGWFGSVSGQVLYCLVGDIPL